MDGNGNSNTVAYGVGQRYGQWERNGNKQR
jgi:hypothetical protein